ncbi:hypothetical protein Tco_1483032 [Tanacetum coccineum]
MKMEILLEIKLVTTGKKRWCDSIRIKLVPGNGSTVANMRMASTAVKPCQGDSLEFYLITGSIYTNQRGTVVIKTVFDKVTPTKVSAQQDQPEVHLRVLSAAKVLADAARKRRKVVNVQSYTRRRRAVSIGRAEISTAEESVSTAGASMPVSTAGMVQEVGTPSSVATKDKAEGQRIARVYEETSSFNIEEWEDIQAIIEADAELAQRIQEEER